MHTLRLNALVWIFSECHDSNGLARAACQGSTSVCTLQLQVGPKCAGGAGAANPQAFPHVHQRSSTCSAVSVTSAKTAPNLSNVITPRLSTKVDANATRNRIAFQRLASPCTFFLPDALFSLYKTQQLARAAFRTMQATALHYTGALRQQRAPNRLLRFTSDDKGIRP